MAKKRNYRFNKGGFTLGELLVVIAIIAVLVAIAIPIFKGQMKKAQEATNKANIRSAISISYADYLEKDRSGKAKYLYNLRREKLYDADKDNFSQKTVLLPVKSQKKGIYAGVFVLIDENDAQSPIKSYPYVDKKREVRGMCWADRKSVV